VSTQTEELTPKELLAKEDEKEEKDYTMLFN
jgi:hypothetical protein